jgi:hypothetical protein
MEESHDRSRIGPVGAIELHETATILDSWPIAMDIGHSGRFKVDEGTGFLSCGVGKQFVCFKVLELA